MSACRKISEGNKDIYEQDGPVENAIPVLDLSANIKHSVSQRCVRTECVDTFETFLVLCINLTDNSTDESEQRSKT